MNAFQNFTLLSVPDYAPCTMTEYGRPRRVKTSLKALNNLFRNGELRHHDD